MKSDLTPQNALRHDSAAALLLLLLLLLFDVLLL